MANTTVSVCFNPLQVQIKPDTPMAVNPYHHSFNPLQVQTKHGLHKQCFQSKHDRVSIPYRYKQNFLIYFFQASMSVSQSPIGTNKTQQVSDSPRQRYYISIPYRYKQNNAFSLGMLQGTSGFNPLQVQTKLKKEDSMASAIFLFQSPIGTNKTTK